MCHLVRCGPERTPEEGCGGKETDVWSYADQLIRDYPSFGQIRKVVNENSKQIRIIRLFSIWKKASFVYDSMSLQNFQM